LVQRGGTVEAPLLLSPAPDNVSGPPHDLAFTRREADSPDEVFENSDECGVGRRDQFIPNRRPAFRIAVTAYGRDEDRRRSHEAGFELHLVKPVGPDDLHRVLN
jgi:CheY-like chemotaxis protein